MGDLIQNITPMMEILCAFFFIISFGSFKELMFKLLDYHNWKKALVLDVSDKAKDLIDSMKEYMHLSLPQKVLTDMMESRKALIHAFRKYRLGVFKIEIKPTYCFSKISFTSGLYCLTILIVASLSLEHCSTGLMYYNIIFFVWVSILSFVDYRLRWWKESNWQRTIKVVLFELTHLKSGFFICIVFLLLIGNSLHPVIYFPKVEQEWLYISSFFAPLIVIVYYTSNYLLQYRHFRQEVRKLNNGFLIEIGNANDSYEKAIYAHETMMSVHSPSDE